MSDNAVLASKMKEVWNQLLRDLEFNYSSQVMTQFWSIWADFRRVGKIYFLVNKEGIENNKPHKHLHCNCGHELEQAGETDHHATYYPCPVCSERRYRDGLMQATSEVYAKAYGAGFDNGVKRGGEKEPAHPLHPSPIMCAFCDVLWGINYNIHGCPSCGNKKYIRNANQPKLKAFIEKEHTQPASPENILCAFCNVEYMGHPCRICGNKKYVRYASQPKLRPWRCAFCDKVGIDPERVCVCGHYAPVRINHE